MRAVVREVVGLVMEERERMVMEEGEVMENRKAWGELR